MLTGIFAANGGNFCRQEVHDGAILVSGPNGAIEAKKAGAGAFFSAETEGTVEQTGYKPFESNRNFGKFAAELLDDAIDQATADQRLANGDVRGPLWAVGQEITNGNRQVVVRIHQAGSGRNDSVTIRIRIIREGYLVLVFQAHQSRHG